MITNVVVSQERHNTQQGSGVEEGEDRSSGNRCTHWSDSGTNEQTSKDRMGSLCIYRGGDTVNQSELLRWGRLEVDGGVSAGRGVTMMIN